MEPKVTKHEKRLDLSYELPHRIRCSAVYPVPAPNGSTIILYGTDDGLRLLWRGGRRIKAPQSPQATKASNSQVIVLDDSDDDIPTQAEPISNLSYEDEEDGIDEEGSYPGIIHDLTISTRDSVSRIAVPIVSSQWPHNASGAALEVAIVAVALINGEVLILRIPLSPLTTFNNLTRASDIVRQAAELCQEGPFVRDLSLRFYGHAETAVCVAAITNKLELGKFELAELPDDVERMTVTVEHLPTAVSFHPTSRQPVLLLPDSTGTCRIFEPSSTWPPPSDLSEPHAQGTWLADLHAPFTAPSSRLTSLPRRKRILGADWVLNGRCVLMILDDGAWGIWDTTASYSKDKGLDDPIVSGYLDSTASTEAADSVPPKRTGPLLAPMTPNTRKTKSTSLFSAPQARSAAAASRGGITVSRTVSSVGGADECVIIWIQNNVYTIPSIQTFWQRSTSGSGGLGSLYAPGIAHVQTIELFHECITSISQLPSSSRTADSTKLTRTPDLALSAESRVIVVQHKPIRGFLTSVEKHVAHSQDQRMLDAGELDLGGMDRILSTMTGTDARPRRVGFAH